MKNKITFKVEMNYSYGWDDAGWTLSDEHGDKPMRFDTVADALAEIADHCGCTVEAVKAGDMESADAASDYRVVPVNASQHLRRGWSFYPLPPLPLDHFPEDLDLIRSLVGSICYETKLIDGAAFFIRRVD